MEAFIRSKRSIKSAMARMNGDSKFTWMARACLMPQPHRACLSIALHGTSIRSCFVYRKDWGAGRFASGGDSLRISTRPAFIGKRLGGGMRQAGILAAAGLVALADVPERLVSDHANARLLAERLADLPQLSVDSSRVQTNIVIFGIEKLGCSTNEFSGELERRGVLANGVSSTHMRLVTHRDVTRADCEQAIEAIREAVCRFQPQAVSSEQ